MKSLLAVIVLLFYTFAVSAQSVSERYPKQYFKWPVGAEIGLAANFGELRPNHYHMGLDCRTERRENVPVYAAAEGYVAKVKIEPWGFGRAIYVNHPNGLTTLYAHLNKFFPALEKYVTEQQYKLQKWNIFIDIPEGLIPLTKGQLLAYSGNTGGSQGPHLHFEIRDTRTDKVLNPLLFDFPITDNTPPDIIRLAMYDRCLSTYEQVPKMIALKKVNGIYQPVNGNLTVNTDRVSFSITSYDRYTGSTNQNGIFSAAIFDNDIAVCSFEMDSISYDETRYLNAHIDYRTKSRGGPYLQHLSNLPGHNNGIYKMQTGNGVISLEDRASHNIKIMVYDASNNKSEIHLNIKASADLSVPVKPADHRLFHPGMINIFENENIRFYLPEKSLYDSFRFTYKESISATGGKLFHLHEATVPVHNYFPISIKGDFAPEDTGRIIMKRTYGAKTDYKKATGRNGWYTSFFREFGNFQLLADTTKPVISAVSRSATGLRFTVVDNTEELNDVTVLLDGKWLRFSNDKGRTFIYTFDEYCPPGVHELKIVAEDQAGNKSERILNFTR